MLRCSPGGVVLGVGPGQLCVLRGVPPHVRAAPDQGSLTHAGEPGRNSGHALAPVERIVLITVYFKKIIKLLRLTLSLLACLSQTLAVGFEACLLIQLRLWAIK